MTALRRFTYSSVKLAVLRAESNKSITTLTVSCILSWPNIKKSLIIKKKVCTYTAVCLGH